MPGSQPGPRAPLLVGVLNVTPDSFSDPGRTFDRERAVAAGLAMAADGADWIDVGGESTRPGAVPVDAVEEQSRVLPVIAALARQLGGKARICIDTYKASTARAALAAGAAVVNDVSGGMLDPDILRVVGEAGATVVLGHLRGRPATMMDAPAFDDVVADVIRELGQRVAAARAAGCADPWVDPGLGFGKRLPDNLALMAAIAGIRAALGVNLMIGPSRKRFIGDLTGRAVQDRTFGTAAAVTAAVLAGADAVRVHDVGPMRDVVAVATALRDQAHRTKTP